MGFTHHPHGVSSFGMPLIPSFGVGKDSKVFFADSINGNDARGGQAPDEAVRTLSRGYSLLRAGSHDTLCLIGLGTSFGISSAFTWAKDDTHLVGLTAPIPVAQRARIATSAVFTPAITWSAKRCTVRNVHFQQLGNHATNAAVCMLVTGERNYFYNCHIAGGFGALAAADASMRSLVVSGGGSGFGENLFERCTIGLDTVQRGNVANAELAFTTQATRNTFRQCMFVKNALAGVSVFVDAPAGSLDRWALFDECIFHNSTLGGGGALTGAFTVNAGAGGNIILRKPLFIGCTDVSNPAANALIWSDPDAAAAALGLAINPA